LPQRKIIQAYVGWAKAALSKRRNASNIYAEEMTDRVELITKEVEGNQFTAIRFYLELPATVGGVQHQAPFMHRPGDDDSSAVTFWGKQDLRPLLRKALAFWISTIRSRRRKQSEPI